MDIFKSTRDNKADMTTSFYKYLKPWDPEGEYVPKKKVVTCFLQSENEYLVLQRARNDEQYGLWGIPGGKIEEHEQPIPGLTREIVEETGISNISEFTLLGTALSNTATDGEYGLYIFHAFLQKRDAIQINLDEHLSFMWVSLFDFQNLNLLTAQGEAFDIVYQKLYNFQNRLL